MSAPLKTVEPTEIAFFFQTNEPVPARPLLDFLYEVERIAHSRRYIGPDAIVEIMEVVTGTKLVRMSFNRKVAFTSVGLAGASLTVAVAQLGNDLVGRIQQPTGRLAESVARMCLDHGVAECVVTTPEGQVQISRDAIKAIAVLQSRRDIAEATADMPTGPRPKSLLSDERVLADERILAQRIEDIRPASPGREHDGRIYTLVGRLQSPGAGSRDWRFSSQSGTIYIARGVNPERSSIQRDATVVIRAEVWGREQGATVLNVKDVFEPEEP
jgi:hypothetical protein